MMSHQDWLRAFLISAALLSSYAYFYESGGWNTQSRLDLTRSIVEHRTLSIDSYHQNTGDKAFFEGHYYPDKAPGLSLAAVPIWEVANGALRITGKDPTSEWAIVAKSYLSTIIVVALPTALAAACLFLLGRRLGASVSGAAFSALTFGLATPMWCYATEFWGHATAAALLLFAYVAAFDIRLFHSEKRDLCSGIAVGLAAGGATVTDYTAAPAALIVTVLALADVWPTNRRRAARVGLAIVLGALPCVLVLGSYQILAFGSPFSLGYMHHAFPGSTIEWTTKGGFVGLTYPKWHALTEILVGRQRGLLPLSPVLALAPFGLVLLWRNPDVRKSTIAAAAISLYFVLLNAAFRDWSGGWAIGPRYVSLGLPFLCLALAPLWTWSHWIFRCALALLTLFGATLSLIAVSTNPRPPFFLGQDKFPIQELLWPAFRIGHIPIRHDDWNLGQCAGLSGLASLLPLLLVWVLASAAWLRLERTRL
jgi:hypothetical protein